VPQFTPVAAFGKKDTTIWHGCSLLKAWAGNLLTSSVAGYSMQIQSNWFSLRAAVTAASVGSIIFLAE
jgi:hypothetical protein